MIFQTLKTKALLILSGLVGVLAFLLRLSGLRSKRLKQQRDQYKNQADHAREIAETDNELEAQQRSRRAEVKNEIQDTGVTDELSDPNDWLSKRSDD